jgi:hypothetical protein
MKINKRFVIIKRSIVKEIIFELDGANVGFFLKPKANWALLLKNRARIKIATGPDSYINFIKLEDHLFITGSVRYGFGFSYKILFEDIHGELKKLIKWDK